MAIDCFKQRCQTGGSHDPPSKNRFYTYRTLGCDFNYFIDEKGNADYYEGHSKKFDFDHDTNSHEYWSLRSYSRLEQAINLFSEENIIINWLNER